MTTDPRVEEADEYIRCPVCGEPIDEADEDQYATEPCDNCQDADDYTWD